MLSSLKNIFKVADLRNKVLFTLLMLVLYRLGASIPVPGVDFQAVKQLQKAGRDAGHPRVPEPVLRRRAQPVRHLRPRDHAVHHGVDHHPDPRRGDAEAAGVAGGRGAVGQRKITQWTRYLALAIATLQATALTFLFGRGGGGALLGGRQAPDVVLLPGFPLNRVLLVVLTLVAGTCLLMWMGELITQRGIGNGMSILIFASVVSTLPFQYYAILKEKKFVVFAILVLISIGILVAVVFIEQGQRRIPVQFAKRVVGRRQYGGQSTYIPLKVNQAGVIPIIFASSILLLPALLTNIFNWDWLQSFVDTLRPEQPELAAHHRLRPCSSWASPTSTTPSPSTR